MPEHQQHTSGTKPVIAKKSVQKPAYIETDFVSGIEGILAAKLSISAWFIPLALMVLVGILIVWASFSKVDVVSPAIGEIVPSQEVQLIQPKEVGVIREIFVRNGDTVRQGELLVQLEDTDIQSQLAEVREELQQLAIDIAALSQHYDCLNQLNTCKATLQGVTLNNIEWHEVSHALSTDHASIAMAVFAERWLKHETRMGLRENQTLVLQKELAQTEQAIAYSQQLLPMYEKRLSRMRAMQDENLTAGSNVEEALEQVMEQQQTLDRTVLEREYLLARIAVSQSERASLHMDAKAEVSDQLLIKRAEFAIKQKSAEGLQKQLKNKRLVSPVNGTVYDRSIATVGGVVQSAEILMKVLPENAVLQANVKILNKDRGFLEVGDAVVVKVDAYTFTKYGAISGHLDKVSSGVVVDEELGPVYPATIQFDEMNVVVNGVPAAITPGMTVTADIYQGQRLLVEYVLAPLLRYKEEALRER